MRKRRNKQPKTHPDNTSEKLPENFADQAKLPGNERDVIVQEATFSGPIPPPSMLGQYEHILPGMADRLVTITEKEQEQRHIIDEKVMQIESSKAQGSFYISLAMVIAGVICGYFGQTALGIALGTTGPLSGIARIYLKK